MAHRPSIIDFEEMSGPVSPAAGVEMAHQAARLAWLAIKGLRAGSSQVDDEDLALIDDLAFGAMQSTAEVLCLLTENPAAAPPPEVPDDLRVIPGGRRAEPGAP